MFYQTFFQMSCLQLKKAVPPEELESEHFQLKPELYKHTLYLKLLKLCCILKSPQWCFPTQNRRLSINIVCRQIYLSGYIFFMYFSCFLLLALFLYKKIASSFDFIMRKSYNNALKYNSQQPQQPFPCGDLHLLPLHYNSDSASNIYATPSLAKYAEYSIFLKMHKSRRAMAYYCHNEAPLLITPTIQSLEFSDKITKCS